MAGAARLRKDLREAIETELEWIKTGVFDSILTPDGAEKSSKHLESLMDQYVDVARTIMQQLEIWKDVDKKAKLEVEWKSLTERVQLAQTSIAQYLDTCDRMSLMMSRMEKLSTAGSAPDFADFKSVGSPSAPESVAGEVDSSETDKSDDKEGKEMSLQEEIAMAAALEYSKKLSDTQTYPMELAPTVTTVSAPVVSSPKLSSPVVGSDISTGFGAMLGGLYSTPYQGTVSVPATVPGVQGLSTIQDVPRLSTQVSSVDIFKTTPAPQVRPTNAPGLVHGGERDLYDERIRRFTEDILGPDPLVQPTPRRNVRMEEEEPLPRRRLVEQDWGPVGQPRGDPGVYTAERISRPEDQEKRKSEVPLWPNSTQMSSFDQGSRYLTKIPLRKFSGDKKSFASWWQAFSACVDLTEASVGYKVLKLQDCLEGEALEAVKDLGFSETAYNIAKERLQRKYGGDKRRLAIQCAELDTFRPIRDGSAQDLEKLAELLDRLVINLSDRGDKAELGRGYLYLGLLKKLTKTFVTRYERWLFDNHREGNVLTLRGFVNQEAEFLTSASEAVYGLSTDKAGKNKAATAGARTMNSLAGAAGNGKRNGRPYPPCKVCNKDHGVWLCQEFKKLTISQKWDKIREKDICSRCLSGGHKADKCARKKVCTVRNCGRQHHYLLHGNSSVPAVPAQSASSSIPKVDATGVTGSKSTDTPTSDTPSTSSPGVPQVEKSAEGNTNTQTYMASSVKAGGKPYISFRTVPVLLKFGNRQVRLNALLDDASNRSYINEEVADYLGLDGPVKMLKVHVLNGNTQAVPSKTVTCILESDSKEVSVNFTACTIPQIAAHYEVTSFNDYKSQWPHLRDIDFPAPAGKRVEVLIGMEYLALMKSNIDIGGALSSDPIARHTPLGWTCVGCTDMDDDLGTFTCYSKFVSSPKPVKPLEKTADIHSLIEKFWEVDTFDSKPVYTEAEQQAVTQVKKSLSYSNGKFTVGVPWKYGRPEKGNNYRKAKKRLISTERGLRKNDTICQGYCELINDHIRKDYIRKVLEADIENNLAWYLPHFPVVRLLVETTKIRMVFDASDEYEGVSLNSLIHPGPKLQQCLIKVLLRFRRYLYAVTCDVREMYLQILLLLLDRPFHRFLWRNMDSTKEPEVYEFNRVVFGVNASPFLAQFVARENASLFETTKPRAVQTIKESTFMDDGLDSVPSVPEGKALVADLRAIWKHANMDVRKFISNSIEILEGIPSEYHGAKVDLSRHELPVVKALGVFWDSLLDVLKFVTEGISKTVPETKREFLKVIATMFDPLGLIGPFLIVGKIFLQTLWRLGLDWDEPIPDQLHSKIGDWLAELSLVSEISIPRVLQPVIDTEVQLHAYGDASDEAYGVVVYIRVLREAMEPWINLVMSKVRVAPLMKLNTPRLELLAPVLAAELTDKIGEVLEVPKEKRFHWSDSMDVLFWVRGCSRNYKGFVGNRIGEIQRLTLPSSWQHVDGKENPADMLSRGVKLADLKEDKLWWRGPAYLIQDKEYWPHKSFDVKERVTHELKHGYTFHAMTQEVLESSSLLNPQVLSGLQLNLNRFNSFKKCARYIAWLFLAVRRFKGVTGTQQAWLTSEQIFESKQALIKVAQWDVYKDEIRALKGDRRPVDNSPIAGLCPWLDEDGILRGNTRLSSAESVPWSMKYPILMGRYHCVTRMLVYDEHNASGHSGTNHVLSRLCSLFWIPQARDVINHTELACAKCRLLKAQRIQPQMGPLPAARVDGVSYPFRIISLDYAGPFGTKQGRGKVRQKRYLCLYTCWHTRGVHIELVTDMSTQAFLMSFDRMIARRGKPSKVHSDQGSNFVSGRRELHELRKALDEKRILQSTVDAEISWDFHPPLTPHFSGVHEVMVRALKRGLRAVIQPGVLTDEELYTVVCNVERTLNNRPLTYMSSNPKDFTPLTPNDFLLGRQSFNLVPPEIFKPGETWRERWRHVQSVVSEVWRRWMQEWVSSLSPRAKWLKIGRDLRVGDVVLIAEQNLPRNRWLLGRVLRVYPGQDGVVRVADVQTRNGVYRRPAVKLCHITDG